jgi:hypothetical protein
MPLASFSPTVQILRSSGMSAIDCEPPFITINRTTSPRWQTTAAGEPRDEAAPCLPRRRGWPRYLEPPTLARPLRPLPKMDAQMISCTS